MYTHRADSIRTAGPALAATGKALILLHGRGASAADILSLQQLLNVADFTLFAPQATQNSWYPYSFMAPVAQNQPALDSALQLIDSLVKKITGEGVEPEQLYFLGFSQGACLTLEYVARHAKTYGGVVAFTGGLIGDTINKTPYTGKLENTPMLLSTGDPDPHVPLQRVEASKKIMEEMGAEVTLKVYKGRPHTILQEELVLANQLLFS